MKVAYSQCIMIVEDSNEDFEATLRAFKKSRLNNPLQRFSTGDEALDYLKTLENDSSLSKPGIILLDLNLPGLDGKELLQYIKTSEILKIIPVVVLTTSNDEKDIVQCYQKGANSYIPKPVNVEKLVNSRPCKIFCVNGISN